MKNGLTISELEIGKAAEHLVCCDLIMQGYRAFLSDQGLPYDVVVDYKGRLIRIQVKATLKIRPVPQRVNWTPAYLWHVRRAGKKGKRRYGNNEFEMLALVALDIKQTAFFPIGDKVKSCIYLRPPGTVPIVKHQKLGNIDQYPFKKALEEVLGD